MEDNTSATINSMHGARQKEFLMSVLHPIAQLQTVELKDKIEQY